MIFEHIQYQDRTFRFAPPLVPDVTRDEETGTLYVAGDVALGIHAYAETRDQLIAEIAEQVAFNWDEYANESPETLCRGAQQLHVALLARVTRVHTTS